MAATYSSFMTTRFYSPVFNTALFDGPFRIYFSQSYESAALKVYHLLQTEHQVLWQRLKQWSLSTKDHCFVMIYPDQQGLDMVFYDQKNNLVGLQEWEEGLALGMAQPKDDEEFQIQMQQLEKKLNQWVCDHLSRSERSPEIT